jgi:RNA polymerase sigma-70 factor (ECF subfamily)
VITDQSVTRKVPQESWVKSVDATDRQHLPGLELEGDMASVTPLGLGEPGGSSRTRCAADRDDEDERWVAGMVADHGAAVLRYGVRLTSDPHAAEDAVQEAMLRAWRNRHVLDASRGSIRGWLLTVVRNIIIDRSRARASRPAEVPEFPDVPPVERDHADRLATAIDVYAVLKKLRPEYREVLIELYYRDRSAADTAALLGIPLGTVKSRAYYGLREVRALMAGSGIR